jgi:acetyl esterase/lipase
MTLPVWAGTPPFWNPADDGPKPVLELYPHPGGSVRPCMLICPGGGYNVLAPHEDLPFRDFFHSMGCHAAVLRYRLQFAAQPQPLGKGPFLDAEKAMGLLRENATAWQIDPLRIGVIGFSAGAHVAGCLSVHGTPPSRPDAAILCYGVLLSGEKGHQGSIGNLCGQDDRDNLKAFFNLPSHVTPKTPPTFLWHTADDSAVRVENSYAMAGALTDQGVPHALHVFPQGRHGLGMAQGDSLVSAWPGLCRAWLRDLWRIE